MKDDLISRQDAIDALDKRFDDVPVELTAEILQLRRELRERLPSAQLEERTKKRTETHACDLIKRQDAIDALCKRCDLVNDDTCGEKCIDIKILEKLPSAEPWKGDK